MATSRRALMLTADGFEDLEVLVPKCRLEEAGWEVDIAAPDEGRVEGEHGYRVDARHALDDVQPEDYELLVLPGGPPEGGAGTVRSYRSARRIVQHFFEESKPVAAICHGPWVLVSADAVEGRRLTSVDSDGVPAEIEDGGGNWVDEEVVVDNNLVTSRTPEDLPAFCREMMNLVETRGRNGHARRNGAAKSARNGMVKVTSKSAKRTAKSARSGEGGSIEREA